MGRLKALPARLGALAPRLGYAPGDRKAYDAKRAREQPGRALYKTAEWRKLRQFVFERDGYVCQQTGVLCTGRAPAPNSPVADHIVRHNGDRKRFFDPDNVQTVSKAWHDSVKQKQERAEELGP